ncbi:hypothetical protein [Gemmatimonas sp.]
MSTSPSSSLSSRARNAAVVVALVAVGLAARSGEQQPAPVAQPAQPPVAPAAPAMPDSATIDSAVVGADSLLDSTAVAALDSMTVAMEAKAAEVATAPAAWPVDAETGQTLINGRPVVGRVFIMRKTDGTVKYPNVADVIAHEALAPLPAVVGTSYSQAPLTHQRRMRGVMIQSTLWDMDHKRSAVRQRYYPASTPANQLGQ